MREINDIRNELKNSFMANDELVAKYGLDPDYSFDEQFSKVSLESLWIDVIAFSIWLLEQFFEQHTEEVYDAIAQLRPHTARWYRTKALSFLYGFDLIEDTDLFDTDGASDEQIAAAAIVKYAAVVEADDESRLIIKIAGEDENGVLSPIPDGTGGTDNVKAAFDYYMSEIKDAGVPLTIINYLPDRLKLDITIQRDPLILDENGMNILSGLETVKMAIRDFMKELPFNGSLSLQKLTDKIQAVPGVLDLTINNAQTSWIDAAIDDYGNYENIYMSKLPVAGYFAVELEDDQDINYSNINYV